MSGFFLPNKINYSCTQCGKSCSQFEEITVEPASRKRLEEINYRELMTEGTRHLDPLVPSPVDDRREMLVKHCGHCVFQGEDKLCRIHAKHGLLQKPQTCQDFPFRYVETPVGTWVGLSFACTAVQANSGQPVVEQGEDLKERRARSNRRQDVARVVQLTPRHAISWDAYLALETDLNTIIETPDQPFGLRLLAQSCYLDLYAAFLREVRGDKPLASSAAASTPGEFPPDATVPDVQVLETLRRRYLPAEVFRLAARLRGSATLHRAFIGLMTAFRQNLYIKGKKPGRFSTMSRIFFHYVMNAGKMGSINLQALGKKFNYSDFRRIDFPENEIQNNELLTRFFGHLLFRKDLLLGGTVIMSHRLMLMQYALIRWHAVGIAALTAAPAVDNQCLRDAIGHVERHYVYHTPFGQLFEDLPVLGMLLDAITRRPAYAASMVVSPT